ncbi:MAG TPA: hypothetical protein VHF67_08345 [Gaiellaceae bacterium]|nr:hypothetical protein [Gaiellaceae bacterium]
MATTDPWTYRSGIAVSDFVGYDVEAVDGAIGEVSKASYDAGASYVVVDTGPWVFGKKVMLPAITVERVDHGVGCVWLDQTKDQIVNAPDFDEKRYRDYDYRNRIAAYYTGRVAPSAGATDGKPAREETSASAGPARARGRFRYRLVDLSGSEVAHVRSERALRADDHVVVPSRHGEATWRVVAVLGNCATVVAADSSREGSTQQSA